jgi:hypothetical protein
MRRFYVSRPNSNPCGRELLPFLLLHCTPRYINFNSSYSTSTGSLKASAYSGGPIGRRIQFLHSQGGPVSARSGLDPRTTSQAFGSVLIQRTTHVGSPTAPNILIQKLWWRNLPNMAPRMVSMPARAAARECSRCGFPSEHMGLTTGWRCLRKQAAVPIKSS